MKAMLSRNLFGGFISRYTTECRLSQTHVAQASLEDSVLLPQPPKVLGYGHPPLCSITDFNAFWPGVSQKLPYSILSAGRIEVHTPQLQSSHPPEDSICPKTGLCWGLVSLSLAQLLLTPSAQVPGEAELPADFTESESAM